MPLFSPFIQPVWATVGEVLRQRQQPLTDVLHLDEGSVLLGVYDNGAMRHQLGQVEGPFWLDAAFALLVQPCAVDMVAATAVQLRRVPLEEFRRLTQSLPPTACRLLENMARGYCQHTEQAVSRLAQDAETRCAQWLLRHAQQDANGTLRVTLHQRKRLIAAQLGIAPETFSRMLRHLREHGLIAGSGNVLNLPQPQVLRLMAGG